MIIIDDNDMRHLFHASTWVNTTPCQMNRKKSAVLFYIHMFLELQGCTYLELGDLFICLSKFTLSCVYVVLSFVFFARISSTNTQISLSTSRIWEKMLATKALISKWWVHFGALSWHAEETTCWLFCHLSQKICRYALVITDYALRLLKQQDADMHL